MKCKNGEWKCPYHACMSNDCQKSQVLEHGSDFGWGKCEAIDLGRTSTMAAELIQTAVLMLAEQTDQRDHASLLRRFAIDIDKQLPQGSLK